MKKKMKRYEEGGVADENFTADQLKFLGGADRTDPYILARMRSAFPDKPVSTSSSKTDTDNLRDETGEVSKIRRNPETGDLYSTEMSVSKPKPVASKPSTTTVAKPEVSKKTEAPAKKQTFGRDIRSEKQKAAGVESSFLRGTKGYNLSDLTNKLSSMLPEGRDIRNEKQKASGEEPSFLRGTKGYNLSDFTMKKGGAVKVSSASKRADGCAIRGKTRA